MKIERVIVLGLGLIAFILVVLKAWFTPITVDEATTYFDYIQKGTIWPWANKWDANNHLLNSYLAWFSSSVFGSHRFVVRLPNVLSFLLLVWSIHEISKKHFRQRWSGVVLALLLFCSPFVLELFSLCRGYGVSLALLMVFILHFLNFVRGKKASIYMMVLLQFLMLASNLTLLVPNLVFWAIIGLLMWQRKDFRIAPMLTWGLVLIAFIYYGFELKSRGLLYYGCESFWAITVKYTTALYTGTPYLWWFSIALFVLSAAGLALDRTNWDQLSTFKVVFAVALLSVLGPVLQHITMDVPLPQDRTIVHAIVLGALAFVLAIDLSSNKLVRLGALLFACLIPAGAFSSLRLDRSALWGDEIFPAAAAGEFESFEGEHGRTPRVLTDSRYGQIWKFENEALGVLYPMGYWQRYRQAYKGVDYLVISKGCALKEGVEGFDTISWQEDENYILLKNSANPELMKISDVNLDLSAVDQTTDYEMLFDSVFQSPVGILTYDLYLNLQIPATTKELFVVRDTRYSEEDSSSYHMTDLADYRNFSPLYREEAFSLQLFEDATKPAHVRLYLWNPGRINMRLTEANIKVFSYFSE